MFCKNKLIEIKSSQNNHASILMLKKLGNEVSSVD